MQAAAAPENKGAQGQGLHFREGFNRLNRPKFESPVGSITSEDLALTKRQSYGFTGDPFEGAHED